MLIDIIGHLECLIGYQIEMSKWISNWKSKLIYHCNLLAFFNPPSLFYGVIFIHSITGFQTRKMKFLKTLKNEMSNFLESTTVHGLVYLNQSQTKIEKAYWISILFLIICFSCSFIKDMTLSWKENVAFISVKSTGRPNEIKIPSLSLCLNNIYGTSKEKHFMSNYMNYISTADEHYIESISPFLYNQFSDTLYKMKYRLKEYGREEKVADIVYKYEFLDKQSLIGENQGCFIRKRTELFI